jgi:glycosyltransferase involved in cell wall biosynthesis
MESAERGRVVTGAKIHQFHYWAAGTDAITNQMLWIQKVLAEEGVAGEVFAVSIKERTPAAVKKWTAQEIGPNDLLLIHHSQGNPILESLLELDIKRGLVYHNITPAEFFRHDPHIASLCRQGRTQLPLFKDRITQAFTVSDYNAKELESFGLGDALKLPLFDFESLQKQMSSAKRSPKPYRVLFVGRFSTHKNQAALIETLFFLRQFQPKCELVLVGTGHPIYSQYLRDLAQVLEVSDRVQFLSSLPESERDEIYLSAGIFLCLSRHEGFCIPIVEAMAAGVPVVSTTHAALSETLGGAGVALKTEQPAEVAAIIQAILTDSKVLTAIAADQKRRLSEIAKEQTAKQILKSLLLSGKTAALRKPPAKIKPKGKTNAPKRAVKRSKPVR